MKDTTNFIKQIKLYENTMNNYTSKYQITQVKQTDSPMQNVPTLSQEKL